jgi:hypothetical protein
MNDAFFVRSACGVVACLAGATLSSAALAGDNPLIVVVANGPHAGTYKPPAGEVICVHSRSQRVYSAGWKDFSAHDPKAIAEAGVQVDDPDEAGPKRGHARISFGDTGKNPTVYVTVVQPLTLTIKGKVGEIVLDGKTADGIALHMTVTCTDLVEG